MRGQRAGRRPRTPAGPGTRQCKRGELAVPPCPYGSRRRRFILDLAQVNMAVKQLAEARTVAHNVAPPLLRAWLVTAHGEGLAAAVQRDNALRAFDAAGGLPSTDPVDP